MEMIVWKGEELKQTKSYYYVLLRFWLCVCWEFGCKMYKYDLEMIWLLVVVEWSEKVTLDENKILEIYDTCSCAFKWNFFLY